MRMTLSATLLACASVGAAETIRVPLEPGERPEIRSSCFLEAGKGAAGVPFAAADGRLRFQIKDETILLDRNLDGKLTSRDRPALGQGQRLTLDLDLGQRVKYPLTVQWLHREFASLTSSFALVGTWQGATLAVVDGDCDGRFTSPGSDGIVVLREGKPAGHPTPLGGLLAIGDRLVEARLDDDAGALLLAPYDGPVGRIAVTGAGELTLVHAQDRQVLPLAAGDSAPAVPGAWRVASGQLHLPGGGLLASAEGDALELAAGGELALALVAPGRLESDACRTGQGQVEITDVWLTGPGGLRWQARVMGEVEAAPAILARGAGRSVALGKIEYG